MKASYGYNSHYLTRDEKPWFPVMGEMHYSRYKESLWEESLRKMKAGGVSIVSAYEIWIHHEEEEGIFDFSGCRNLRGFLQACKNVGISVFLRLGPWVHGEVRNGGFPDWLQKKEQEGVLLRSNDPVYMEYVKRYWQQLFEQASGFLYEDGGPVIGVQIENEYGHVGGLRGEAGEAHIRALTALAEEIGFRLPLRTATGWGGACIGDLLPVMGGYCEAPWDQRLTEIEPNTNFVFSHVRNDALIACDHHVEDAITFDQSKFPYLTAELGGGLQVTKHRRPVAAGKDIGAMSLSKLGSGVALLGYYMYHGGSNPDGKLSTLQESRATGYLNDLPEINYDFNAPIRQYGTISDSYREVKLLAYFLEDFGADLAVLPAEIFPENVKPSDLETLRLSWRHDADHGYVFYNNYQRRHSMADHENVVLEGRLDGTGVVFPAIHIADGEYGFFPYNMKLGNAVLQSALATPLCCLRGAAVDRCGDGSALGGDIYVFYGDRDPHFIWKGELQADVLLLSRADALHAFRVKTDREYLILADDYVWEENGKIRIVGDSCTAVKCFPNPTGGIEGFAACGQEGRFTVYERRCEECEVAVELSRMHRDDAGVVSAVGPLTAQNGTAEYELSIRYDKKTEHLRDLLLELTWAGESMDVYLGDKKINDFFYTGQTALLSLGYFEYPEKLRIAVHALHENEPVFLETWPVMEGGMACRIEAVKVKQQYL